MSKRTYAEKLRDPRWQKKRLEILERDEWRCRRCGDPTKTLHVHHGYYEPGYEPWDYDSRTMWTLCEECHENTQAELRDLHMELAKINPIEFTLVMRHLLATQKTGFTANPWMVVVGYESLIEAEP